MEIIMKVKCSRSPGAGGSQHSTLKIVDNHHQLQQHTFANTVHESSSLPNNVIPARTFTQNTHHSNEKYTITSTNPSSCTDCSVDYCCSISSCCVRTPPPQYSQTSPQSTPSTLAQPYPHLEPYAAHNHQNEIVEEPEFVSIDDEKVKQYLIRLGQQQLQKKQHNQKTSLQREPKITHVVSAPTIENTVKPVVYEIIELDDEDEREKLKQIKQQAERSLAGKKLPPNLSINLANRQTKSLDISLIPKNRSNEHVKLNPETAFSSIYKSTGEGNKTSSNHKIVAKIDLVESDEDDPYMNDDDADENDDTLPLAAVTCELQYGDEDDNTSSYVLKHSYNTNFSQQHQSSMKYSKPLVDDVAIVGSREYKSSDDVLVRWDEYEVQRERVFFECFLCGKKVQSSYNLRRHMMIHTGERPFGCDLCDRRFREFSDMKKHRRRHSNESNYLCMICHKRAPLDSDPTRCINCCTQSKNAVIMAAMKTASDADLASEQSGRIRAANSAEKSQASITQLYHQQTLPTITSVTSYNIAAIRTKTPTSTTSQASTNNTTKTSESSHRFLDDIPAVHRPGYNKLGMITRKEFPCPLCNRAFGTRHNLKRHYMIHTGEKPFSCTKCRKPFREYSTLKKHMVTHMRERWYKCMRCPMKFRDFLKYTEHKESHRNDSDSEEQPIPAYKQYNSIQVDDYTDSNDEDSGAEDWLECCECAQRFSEIDVYNKHLKEHDSSNQIFQCYICKQQYQTRTDLDQHIKKQHKLDSIDSMDEENDDISTV